MMEPITIFEAIAMVFYLMAIYICFLQYKKSHPGFRIVFVLIMLALFIAACISLMDVLQWTSLGLAFLVEKMEEVLTPLFGFLWATAAYAAVKRTKKIVTKGTKEKESEH